MSKTMEMEVKEAEVKKNEEEEVSPFCQYFIDRLVELEGER